jgi:hypothetical protein
MLAESPQSMPKNDLDEAIEDAPTTRTEPFWSGSQSNFFLMLCITFSEFFILLFSNSRRTRR